MVRVDKLRGRMAEKGYTVKKLAEEIGIVPRTLAAKMERGVFTSAEMPVIAKVLDIENPLEIFFAE
jgi:lambda repressor-like predicted transcriptional regulator